MRHMVSAVQVVVDVDLPVAVNVVSAAIKELQPADPERRNALHDSPEKFVQRRSFRIEVHEYETLPHFDSDRHKAVVRAAEVLHAFELGHAFERTIQTILPTVVRTLQDLRLSTRLRNNGGRMMATHVEKSAQRPIHAAHNNDGLTRDACRDKVSSILQLACTCDELPRLA